MADAQVASKKTTAQWRDVVVAYHAKDINQLRRSGQRLLELLLDTDLMVSTVR